LTYHFPAFANEMRIRKHLLQMIRTEIKIFLLKWNKNQRCETPNETRGNKP